MERNADVLPQNRFATVIRRAGQVDREFKSRQRLSGASGQLGYLVETANTWDLTETIPDNPSAPTHEFLLTFTGDGTQSFPVVMPYLDLRINGTADSNKIDYLPGHFGALGWESGGVSVQLVGGMRIDSAYFEDEYVQRWRFFIICTGEITYFAKVQAMASSDGTVQIVRLS